ncbi:DUF262 domain-containing protein [Myroides sp. LJL110]
MNIISFEQVFASRIFRIPDYQRGYSWSKKELEELWIDLENTHHLRGDYHFTGILTLTDFNSFDLQSIKKEGFIVRSGNLLVNNKVFSGYNIVDGQQRLTSILILLSQLIFALQDSDFKDSLIEAYLKIQFNGNSLYRFGYHVDVPSHNYLIREIYSDSSYDLEETETLYTHNLSFAKSYFYQKVADFTQKDLEFWIDKITKSLLFSILNLHQGKTKNLDVSMVFETLNFRGKQLSSLERLKNRVLYITSKQLAASGIIDKSRKRINQSWLQVYKWLGRHPQEPLDDDGFLKAFWLLYFSRANMVSADFKSYQKHLFTIDFKLDELKADNHVNYAGYQELNLWLDSMKKSVMLWFFINNPYLVDTDKDFDYYYTSEIQYSLYRIGSFPRGYGKYMLGLILAIFMRDLPSKSSTLESGEKAKNLAKIQELLFYIERHNIMCFLLQGNNSNLNQEDTFRDINYYYKRARAHSNEYLLDTIAQRRVEHFRWRDVIGHIHKASRFKSWAGLEYFLKEIEQLLGGYIGQGEPKVCLIYPQDDQHEIRGSFRDINTMQKVNRDRYCYSIGNMYLSYQRMPVQSFENLQKRIIKAQQNKARLTKMELELLNYSTWDKQSIEQRGKKMVLAFIEKWQLPSIVDTEIRRLLLDEV